LIEGVDAIIDFYIREFENLKETSFSGMLLDFEPNDLKKFEK
jgi:hypothetical protein